jgi:hypothetical protein
METEEEIRTGTDQFDCSKYLRFKNIVKKNVQISDHSLCLGQNENAFHYYRNNKSVKITCTKNEMTFQQPLKI